MRKKKISLDYVAGFLENAGGFYVFKDNKRKTVYPKFKLVSKAEDRADTIEDIVIFFQTLGIYFQVYRENGSVVYHITKQEALLKLIDFLDKNCRTKKKNQEWIKKILKRRDDILLAAKEGRYERFLDLK